MAGLEFISIKNGLKFSSNITSQPSSSKTPTFLSI